MIERDLSDLVHGPENPLLVHVHCDPAFHVMLDCIARERVPPAMMTGQEAADRLDISESAVRQAIQAKKRLRARKEGGDVLRRSAIGRGIPRQPPGAAVEEHR